MKQVLMARITNCLRRSAVFSAVSLAALSGTIRAQTNALPPGYHLLYEQRFDQKSSIRDFAMTDAKVWKISTNGANAALELFEQSKYTPAVRSPFNIALIADKVFGDFILEVDLLQTGKEYGHRDMCVIFGVNSPTKFYYAHIATAADDHAHNIFIVNEQPRTKIATETTQGVKWGQNVWHKVRLERKTSDGTIRVFYDDMKKPIMTAQNKVFPTGYIGLGSFDDTGKINNIKIWGPRVETKKTDFYQKPE